MKICLTITNSVRRLINQSTFHRYHHHHSASAGCSGNVGLNSGLSASGDAGYNTDYGYSDSRDGNTYINNYYNQGYGYDYDYAQTSAPVATEAPTQAPVRQQNSGNGAFGVGVRLPNLIDPLNILGRGGAQGGLNFGASF